ncbi:HEPN domain-containing protein [Abyssogena phaseoliformis symbiont]|uniref:HEPN domain-containing protein n=1 Tax=Abyssogena phaseoliformis symbiont TaxID=596095 RepID=UPI001916741F|nr:HEPN domain-containing protein [Abyssogena phaseoliformis symbiont]
MRLIIRLKKDNTSLLIQRDQGVVLYEFNRKELAVPGYLTQKACKKMAIIDYEEWFGGANELLISYKANFKRGSYKLSAFELHQATEYYYYYSCLSLVLTQYKS